MLSDATNRHILTWILAQRQEALEVVVEETVDSVFRCYESFKSRSCTEHDSPLNRELSFEELEVLLKNRLVSDVNRLLGVTPTEIPPYNFARGEEDGLCQLWEYNSLTKTIHTSVQGSEYMMNAVPFLTHEYVHHVQDAMWDFLDFMPTKYGVLSEGHAIGVEHTIAKTWGDEGFLAMWYRRAPSDVLDVYYLFCKEKGVPPNRLIVNDKLLAISSNPNAPTNHAVGNVAFLLLEREQGQDIYRKTLHEENLFSL